VLAVTALAWLGGFPASAAELTWGPSVAVAEQRVYSVDYRSDHLGVDESGDPILIGYTLATYQVADIVFSAPWNPAASGNSWDLHTSEGNWSITLSLEEPPWRVEQFGLGPVTFYGFDLSLDNGSWSYTFRSLGGFQDGRLYPSDLEILQPLNPDYQSDRGERAVQITNPFLGVPSETIAPVNGGEIDTGWSQWFLIFGGHVQLEDIPVEDKYWFFSLATHFEDDTITARLGLGLETSRETVFYGIPEPGGALLLLTGLIVLGLWLRPLSRHSGRTNGLSEPRHRT
jgi:hypothetical protein